MSVTWIANQIQYIGYSTKRYMVLLTASVWIIHFIMRARETLMKKKELAFMKKVSIFFINSGISLVEICLRKTTFNMLHLLEETSERLFRNANCLMLAVNQEFCKNQICLFYTQVRFLILIQWKTPLNWDERYSTHLMLLVYFYTPVKQKSSGFLILARDLERDQWHEMN